MEEQTSPSRLSQNMQDASAERVQDIGTDRVMKSGDVMTGEPLQIVTMTDEHGFELDIEKLEKVLLHPDVKNHHVVMASVAGAFRKGKSFILDFFLRYLNAKGAENWLGDPDTPLVGFPWKGGSERYTTGILLWSVPFQVKLFSGETVAVLLMDTQGAFDSQATVKDCATVFALSTMVSSIQIFNLSSNLQEDDLQHLQLFTEYGRLAMEGSTSIPFQSLTFLIRDWPCPYEHTYGLEGGQNLLDKRMEVTSDMHKEHEQLRVHIQKCFNQLRCFLMPHPGLKVSTNPNFDGCINDIEPEFVKYLRILTPAIFSPENLVIKEINGTNVKGKDLVQYFKAYMKIYQGDVLPEPKSMLEATAEANNLAAVSNARDEYQREMEMVCGGDKPYMSPEMLAKEHERCFQLAVQLFDNTRKMGGDTFSVAYREGLDEDLSEMYESLSKHNEGKNIFATARTPAIFFIIAVIAYILSGILNMVGLETMSALVNCILMTCLIVLCIWTYLRYSGEFREVAVQLDRVADIIWELTFGPIAHKALKNHPVAATIADAAGPHGPDKKSK